MEIGIESTNIDNVNVDNVNTHNSNTHNSNTENANNTDGITNADNADVAYGVANVNITSSTDMYKFIGDSLIKSGLSLEKQDICSYSPLTLAYIGDAVYELVIRSMIVTQGNAPVNKLHRQSSSLVKAETQAEYVKYFLEKGLLNEEEMRIYKRGRNAQSYTKAKNASVTDYRMATGFEALIGFLYLSGQSERMLELVGRCLGKDL